MDCHTFPSKFRPFIASEIHKKTTKFLNGLLQTGFLPLLKIGADNGTSTHRTRHFITAVTVIPDSSQLLAYVTMT